MFTIKVFRRGANEEERVHVYQARSFTVHNRDASWLKPGEKGVVWEADNGDNPVVTVSNQPAEGDSFSAYQVIIENADGKTTEVVRP